MFRRILASSLLAPVLGLALMAPTPASAACAMQYPVIGIVKSVAASSGGSTKITLSNVAAFSTNSFASSRTDIDAYNTIAQGYVQNSMQLRSSDVYAGDGAPSGSYDIYVDSSALATITYHTGDVVMQGPPGGAACTQYGFVGFFGTSGIVQAAIATDSGYGSYSYGSDTLTLTPGTKTTCAPADANDGTTCVIPITYSVSGQQFTLNPSASKSLTGTKFAKVSLVRSTKTTFPSTSNVFMEDFDPVTLLHTFIFSGSSGPTVTGSSKAVDNFLFGYSHSDTSNRKSISFSVAFVGDAMCDGASYSIDYGDGNTLAIPRSSYTSYCAAGSGIKTLTGDSDFKSHTYTDAKTYTAKLERNNQALETLSVDTKNDQTVSVHVTPLSGATPLTATITTTCPDAAASDTTTSLMIEGVSGGLNPCSNATFQHTFTTPGTYTLTLNGPSGKTDTEDVTARTADGNDNEDSVSVASCPTLTKTLQRGDTDASTGGEVSKLQQFLTDYFNLDTSIAVGTFGPTTQSYVKQFQTAVGISPVGFVGPQTRSAITAICQLANAYEFAVTPSQGTGPLQVDFTYGDPRQGEVYTVDFGDGTTPGTMLYTTAKNCTFNCSPRYDLPHTYAKNGVYHATVSSVINPCAGKTGCTAPVQTTQLGSAAVSVGQTTTTDKSCLLITHNLFLDTTDGTTGGDVTKLQNFLIASGYMQGSATGYFGPATQAGVQAYQAANGIVSSGTPDTTGYGYVGAKTRSVLSAHCTAASGPFTATPTAGAAPLAVTFNATGLQSGTTYSVDNGDGTATTLTAAAGTCASGSTTCTMSGMHSYASAGTFTAKLMKSTNSVTCTDVSYDVNNPLSYLNLGTSPTCTTTSGASVSVGQVTIIVTGSGGGTGVVRPACGELPNLDVMTPGTSIASCNGAYTLYFQTDGDVVLTKTATQAALWRTGTSGLKSTNFVMQADGNLVLYTGTATTPANAIWASGSTPPTGKAGGGIYGRKAHLLVQNDGNLVVYATDNGQVFWATGTEGQ